MKKGIQLLVVILFSVFINCSEDTVGLIGYGSITGKVVEVNSYEPIENVKISLSSSNNTVFTDAEGHFELLDIEEGEYSVTAEKEGYLTSFEPATVSKNSNVNVIFEMDDDNALNKPPSVPVAISPQDSSEENETTVELKWSKAIDADEDEIFYGLTIRNDYDSEVLTITELTDTTYVLSELRYGTKYFWQISATDNVNNEVLSSVSSFKTKINPENRYLYVKKASNSNNIIYSASFSEDSSETESEIQLTDREVNSWRPRKNQTVELIAFLRNNNNETHIYTMKEDGSDVTQVTSLIPVAGFDLNEIDFAWSSNGDRLLYPHFNKLYIINKDGSGLQEVFETTDGNYITEICWSNDESIIALKTNDIYGYNVSIFTIDMNGNLITEVLNDVRGAAGGLDISVDNKYLLYTYDTSEYESMDYRQLDTRIFLYEFSSNTATNLSISKNSGTIDIDPRFSPNEAEVIFVNTSNDGISEKYIYKLSISDSNSRILLFSNTFMPDWE